MCKKLTFIIYDGIKNSVFSTQVLQPLLNLLDYDKNLEINLISFEKEKPTKQALLNLIPAHNRLHFILCRKLPFFGKLSLKIAVYQLKKIFRILKTQKIIARGPLAGYLAIQVFKKNKVKPKIVIQARGLCAQEYRFAFQFVKESFIKKNFRFFITKKLHQIEYLTYNKKNNVLFDFTIESVSNALKEYLVINFDAQKDKIKIAKNDIPKKLDLKDKVKFKKEIRSKLNLSDDTKIYCYSGSCKPWQCVPDALDYFDKKQKTDKNSFLLLLSKDKKDIQRIIQDKSINNNKYKILSVNPDDLHKYLSACDTGLLFRDKDIINWVSRPTKMLEYQAAGLNVIHNNTIGWLENVK